MVADATHPGRELAYSWASEPIAQVSLESRPQPRWAPLPSLDDRICPRASGWSDSGGLGECQTQDRQTKCWCVPDFLKHWPMLVKTLKF